MTFRRIKLKETKPKWLKLTLVERFKKRMKKACELERQADKVMKRATDMMLEAEALLMESQGNCTHIFKKGRLFCLRCGIDRRDYVWDSED